MSERSYFNLPLVKDGEAYSHANISMTGNYATATDYVLAPSANEVYLITRMIVMLEDTSPVDAAKYGNNITLTNGITVQIEDDSSVLNQLIPTYAPIKTNADWGTMCHDADLKDWGVGNDVLTVRWTFAKGGVEGLRLSGRQNQKFVMTLHDDFTGLIEHHAFLQGYKQTVE